MIIYLVLVLSFLLLNGALAQNLYSLPDNFKSRSISSFENLNVIKGECGKYSHSAILYFYINKPATTLSELPDVGERVDNHQIH